MMNRSMILLGSLLLLAGAVAACTGETPASDVPLSSVTATTGELTFTLDAPEGAVVEPSSYGGRNVTIVAGDAFHLNVFPAHVYEIQEAADHCTNASQNNCEIVSQSDDLVVTKWIQFGEEVHNFTLNLTVGEQEFSCSSDSGSGVAVSQNAVDLLVRSCRTIALAQ
ncbi:MAG: hypothetical protein KC561_09765 [Myxococcales bacterium]|nr:hypothetical protein [Myxococcales bacterium]